jgi:hypothetical protein
MSKLRVLLFIIFGLIPILESFAQTFEIKAGVNLSTMLSKDDRSTYSGDYTLTPRLLFGVTSEIPINQLFSIESGLLFSSKGYKLEKDYALYPTSEPVPVYAKSVLNYFEIPVSIKFSHSILGLPLYGVLGPYAAIGINGKNIIDIYSGGKSERTVYKNHFDSNGLWKRLDYGLQAGAGIQFGKYVFGLNYSYGLANISRHSPHVEKNRIIGLTLGYKFKTSNN